MIIGVNLLYLYGGYPFVKTNILIKIETKNYFLSSRGLAVVTPTLNPSGQQFDPKTQLFTFFY